MSRAANVVPMGAHRNRCQECALAGRCVARDPELLRGIGTSELPGAPRVIHRGDHLFRSGEPLDAVYMVRSGAVKTYVVTESGEEQVVGFHTAGDLIGLDGVHGNEHLCAAQALDTSSVCALPFARLMRLCGRSPTCLRRVLESASRTIVRDEAMLVVLGQKSAEQRLAAFLCDQVQRLQEQGFCGTEFTLAMSRADIGSYLALAVETVSRVLTRLQDAGVIQVQRNLVRVVDPRALRALVRAEPETPRRGPAKRRAAG